MAGKGTYGAYGQLTPIKTDFGDPMERYARGMVSIEQRNQDREFREQQLAAQQKSAALKARQDQYNKDRDFRLKISDKLDEEIAERNLTFTGYASHDEALAEYYSNNTKELGDIRRQLMANPNDYLNNSSLTNRRTNLTNSPKIIEALQKKFTTGYQELTKGIADGSLSKANLPQMDKIENLLGPSETEDGRKVYKYEYRNDPRSGQLMVYGLDSTGKPFKVSAPSVIQGFELSDRIPLVEKDDYIKNKLGLIGKTQKVANIAGGTATVQRWDSKMEDLVTNMVEAELTDGKQPSNTAKSLWVDGYGNDPDSLVNTGELIQKVVNEVRTGYDETVTGFKSASENDSVYAKEVNKARGKRAAEVEQLQSQISLIRDTKTGEPFKMPKILESDPGKLRSTIGFNVPDLELPFGEGGKLRINQVYLDEKTDEIYYSGSMLRGKVSPPGSTRSRPGMPSASSSTPVWKEVTQASPSIISEVANELGFNDAPAFKEYLKGLLGSSQDPARNSFRDKYNY